jgi:Bor protein
MKVMPFVTLLGLAGCMSARLQLHEKFNPDEKPAYVDYFDYYFAGLAGDPELNLQKICMDQKPYGVQRIKSVEDGVITFFTLAIYSPVTVKVWCGE